MMNKLKIVNLIPYITMLTISIIIGIGSSGRMFSLFNLSAIVDQTVVILIGGLGAIFVVAQGSVDLSIGVNMALSGVIGSYIGSLTSPILIIPTAMAVSIVVGLLMGVIISKFKVSSFMVTLATLIGLRGLVNFIQTKVSVQSVPAEFLMINRQAIKIPLLIVIVLIMYFVFEYTKYGRYSKAIGENELAAKFTGIPVAKMKIIAFALSGLMAGVASIFTMAKLGGTSTTMGAFFEIQVMMALFLGGNPVTGGTTTKLYKVLIGAFTITIIQNGLVLLGLSSTETSEAVQGTVLIIVLFVTNLFAKKGQRETA